MSDSRTSAPRSAGINSMRVSTTDAVARELSTEVLDGTIEPGSYLRETELAERFGVSRQSVRGALTQLEFRGLIRRVPHKGGYVPQLTRADVTDLYYLREVVEGEAVRRLSEERSPLDAIEETVAAMENLRPRPSWSEVAEADVAFHRATVDSVGSARLSRAFDLLSGEMLLVIVPARLYMEHTDMAREHRELLEVIRRGDPVKAVARYRQHLELGTDSLMESLPEA